MLGFGKKEEYFTKNDTGESVEYTLNQNAKLDKKSVKKMLGKIVDDANEYNEAFESVSKGILDESEKVVYKTRAEVAKKDLSIKAGSAEKAEILENYVTELTDKYEGKKSSGGRGYEAAAWIAAPGSVAFELVAFYNLPQMVDPVTLISTFLISFVPPLSAGLYLASIADDKDHGWKTYNMMKEIKIEI